MSMSAAPRNLDTPPQTVAGSAFRVYIELLGGLRLHVGNNVITRFRTQKAAGLLAFLAYHPEQRHSREMLAERFWPDTSLTNARNGLNVALSSLRNQIEPPGVPPNSVLVSDSFYVGLNPAQVSTDVARFQELFARAERASKESRVAELLKEALQLGRAELLPGFYDDWIVAEQERLRDRTATASYRLARLLDSSGQREESLIWMRETVRKNPLHTEGVKELFQHLIASGQEAEAAACYSELRERLQTKWSVEPPTEIQALMTPILEAMTPTRRRGRPPGRRGSGHVAVEETVVPAILAPQPQPAALPVTQVKRQNELHAETTSDVRADARGHDTWLPLPLTRFYGRENELHRLRWLLENPTNRVITLTGPGGSGKTRLALTLAERMRDPGGELRGEMRVLFVSLAEVKSDEALPEALAKALGIRENHTGAPMLDCVAEFLAAEPTLLILDNFEQLAQTKASEEVTRLLQYVPSLSCLITSRVRLPIHGEQEFPVLPLPVPDENAVDADTETILRENPAVSLFVDRAQLAVPFFQINRKNASAIIQLVRQLEGIPLAIELAAARSRVMTPVQMVEQMKSRFNLLVSHRNVFEERHRSLRETIAWSMQLLTGEQQTFFLHLCVMCGTWTAEDAESVTCDFMAADHLAALADASLLQMNLNDDCIGYRMLETVREFAEEELLKRVGADGMRLLRDRHVARFLVVAEKLRELRDGPEQMSWMSRIESSHENCCSALEWCLETPGTASLEAAIRIGASLGRYWRQAGWHQRGIAYFRAILQRREFELLSWKTQRSVLVGLGILEMSCRNLDQAQRLFEEGRQLCMGVADDFGAIAILNNLALIASARGDHKTAYQWYSECLRFWQSQRDVGNSIIALTNLGFGAAAMESYEQAQHHLEDALLLAKANSLMSRFGETECYLGFVLMERREFATARRCLVSSLRNLASVHNWRESAIALLGLGRIDAHENGNTDISEYQRVALDYCQLKGVSPVECIPTAESPYWKRMLSPNADRTSASASMIEQRLRQSISWILDDAPTLTYR